MGYLNEEAPFYLFMLSKTMLAVGSKGSLVGWSFILWFMLYLESWSSRSSNYICVA